jgi:Zn-dependent protease
MDQIIVTVSIIFVPIMFAVVCHEVAHGFIAWHFGDPTARMMGRLTLNPIKHVDLMGTIIVPVLLILSHSGILFGWAKPVPVVFENLRNPKRDMIWVAAAGPITNIILATLSAFALRAIIAFTNPAASGSPQAMFIEPVVLMLAYSVYINLLLAIFNMLPIPPLDGGRVMVGLLPRQQSNALSRLEPYGFMILIALVFILPSFFGINIFQLFIKPLVSLGAIILAGPQSSLILNLVN